MKSSQVHASVYGEEIYVTSLKKNSCVEHR